MDKRIGIIGLCCSVFCWTAVAATVADPDNGILWQKVQNAATPIQWRWEGEDVTSARVTIVSPMDAKTHEPVTVTRVAGALYGSVSLPTERVAGREYLYDLTVEFLAGQTLKDTFTARLVVLPETTDVVKADALAKRSVETAALYSYNVRWNESASGVAKVTVQGDKTDVEESLPGSSGYGSFSERILQGLGGLRPTATLSFGGVTYWSNCLRLHGGLVLVVR